ncbi:response regulator transcription factor [Aureivirga marina]|uniref:response regulator transcription factor n=1 Tax=Aureivirga marina TaxID=1182451 RepID=UPI0018CB605C|nr:LuxR C-terminal-related transcriptional regulator [Aureivirga marina]
MKEILTSKNIKAFECLVNVWKNEKLSSEAKVEMMRPDISNITDFFSAGEHYYCVLNLETQNLDFISVHAPKVLGLPMEEICIKNIVSLYDEEDANLLPYKEKTIFHFTREKLNPKEIGKYKIVYTIRLKTPQNQQKIILHQSKALEISETGKILKVLIVQTDITYLQPKIDHSISFISSHSNLPSFYSIDSTIQNFKIKKNYYNFTKKEKEIIGLFSKGLRQKEIADKLCISPLTVKTHKQNIIKKSNAKNITELVTNCIKEGII